MAEQNLHFTTLLLKAQVRFVVTFGTNSAPCIPYELPLGHLVLDVGGAEVHREEDQGEAHHVSAHVRVRSPLSYDILLWIFLGKDKRNAIIIITLSKIIGIIRMIMRASYTESTDMASDGLHWQKRTWAPIVIIIIIIIIVFIVINISIKAVVLVIMIIAVISL